MEKSADNTARPLVLVTGAAGYIGSALTGILLERGYRVRGLDNLMFGGTALLGWLTHERFEFVHGDIRDRAVVTEAMAGVGSVVHLAAIVGDPACREAPELARAVNGDGAELVCDRALSAGVRRFVFASTCSNYGKMPDPTGYVDETAALNPISLYAELKVAFEQRLLGLGRPDVEPVCLRFATVYGLSPRPRFDLTVNEFTRDLTLGRRLEIYGEKFWRPYCHVHDLARACVMAIEAPSELVAYEAFNVGDTRENYQKQGLVELILEQLPDQGDMVAYVSRDEDPRDYRVRFGKIRETIGFTISRRVPDGIREIISAIRTGLVLEPDHPRYSNRRS
ncbi:NAD-dependent epimerase/dehydratase family protein [candidate division GN15 bacterium]|nr:NAD-dependent epimerase/dehydratase family protein [candidate division GN15 bacterium]